MRKGILTMFLALLGTQILLGQWQQLDEPTGGDVLDLAIKNGTLFISVANIIYKSTDNGLTWSDARGNLPSLADINSIGATSTAVYAAVNIFGGFARSVDGGETWNSSNALGNAVPNLIVLNGKLFAGRTSLFTGGGVSISEDAGETWIAPETILNEIVGGVTALSAGGNMLYAQTNSGFYQSQDEGITWTEVSSEGINERFGFFGTSVYHNGSLYFGQSTNSLHKLDFTTVSIKEEGLTEVSTFSLSQNYPNPFNPTTNVTFSIPEASEVRIDVFNMLGQRVGVIASDRFTEGDHTLIFDGSGLSSGVYLYRIEAAGYTETQKMTLIK